MYLIGCFSGKAYQFKKERVERIAITTTSIAVKPSESFSRKNIVFCGVFSQGSFKHTFRNLVHFIDKVTRSKNTVKIITQD